MTSTKALVPSRVTCTVIGVCAGAKVLANTGLLDGKRATTHWYYLKAFRERHPALTYVPDRRLVVDGRIATTTGITAAMPMMLTLIEAVAGQGKAQSAMANASTFRRNRGSSTCGCLRKRNYPIRLAGPCLGPNR